MKNPIYRTTLFLSLALLAAGCASLKTPTFSDEAGAIRGYDPVAYFTEGEPVPGVEQYALQHNGATWYFSSAENLERFQDDPDRYAPQYGGYCAYAMSRGFVVSVDPQAWEIVDDRLYLNYSLGVRNTWRKDIPGYIAKADENWAEKLAQPEFE